LSHSRPKPTNLRQIEMASPKAFRRANAPQTYQFTTYEILNTIRNVQYMPCPPQPSKADNIPAQKR
jgi:hypothetical protein